MMIEAYAEDIARRVEDFLAILDQETDEELSGTLQAGEHRLEYYEAKKKLHNAIKEYRGKWKAWR